MGWTQYLLPIAFLGLIVWVHYILFIGDEKKMADCSKTEVFLKEWKRMCIALQSTCQRCILYEMVNSGGCHTAMRTMPNQAIEAVQKWSDEHPKKTRQSEFLKMFPNAQMESRCLAFCPKLFDTTSICIKDGSGGCRVCIEKYWSEEVE